MEVDAHEGLPVPAVSRRVAEQSLDVRRLDAVVAATLAQERPPDVPVEVHGLPRPWVLRDVEREHRLAVLLVALLGDGHVVAHLRAGVQHGEEVVLHLVRLGDAAHLEALPVLRDAEDDPPAARVREGRDALEDGLRECAMGGLELGVGPFAGVEEGVEAWVGSHGVSGIGIAVTGRRRLGAGS